MIRFFFVDSGISLTKSSIYTQKSNKSIFQDQRHLVPLTAESMALSNRWQRKINEEKERRRNVYLNEEGSNVMAEENDNEDNPSLIKIVEGSLLHNDDGISSNFDAIQPVSTMVVTSGPSQEHIALEFTLNKNQNAAFMIITNHLNGLDVINAGRMIIKRHAPNPNSDPKGLGIEFGFGFGIEFGLDFGFGY